MFYLFPYGKIKRGENVIILGAGFVGECFVKQIAARQYCNIVAIADRNANEIKKKEVFSEYNIITSKDIDNYEYDHIIIAVSKKDRLSALEDIVKNTSCSVEHIITDDYFFYSDTWSVLETVEALIIRKVFDILGIDNPTYWDIGACYPHKASNTEMFYLNGSKGLNVEANDSIKEFFDIYRPDDINVFAGVSQENGKMMLYVSDNPYLTTFSGKAMEISKNIWGAKYIETKEIPTYTIKNISEIYWGATYPDFIDIDIEGLDIEVLRSCDFRKNSPKLICVEGTPKSFNEILMNKNWEAGGYLPYCRSSANIIYLRNDIYQKVLYE